MSGLELSTESRWSFYRSLGRQYWKAIAGMMALVGLYSALMSVRLAAAGIAEILQARYEGKGGKFLNRIDEARIWLLGPQEAPLAQQLQDDAFFYQLLFWILGTFVVISVTMSIAFYFKETLAQSLILRMEVDMRRALFRHLTGQSVAYFNRQRSGDVISRLTNDINAVRQSFKLFFEDVVQQPCVIIGSLAMAFDGAPILTLICIPCYSLLLLPVLWSGKKIIKHGRGRLEKLSVLTESIGQLFSGIRIVKAFGMERREEEEFTEKNKSFIRTTLKMNRAKVKARSLQELLYNIGTALVILAGVWVIAMKWVEPGGFLQFLFAMVQIYMPLKALSNAWNQLQESRGGVDRILEVLREKPLIKDHEGSLAFPGVKESIRFDHVGFSYGALAPRLNGSGAPRESELPLPVLSDLSFSVRAGQVIALVGPSGSGKSTIADLLARFYDPQKGRVLVDERDIREYAYGSYLRSIAIVSQDPFLFHTTIRENIRYGRESASDAEVEEAARTAFAHDFICEQPQGYDTVIGERGVMLSGGQRQRLTIARAVLKNAPILILDEATSSLDSQAEKEVQRAVDNLIKSRTTFIIAHRLSTIVHADKILVLEAGKILESGRHEELLEARGMYYRLWRSQNPEV